MHQSFISNYNPEIDSPWFEPGIVIQYNHVNVIKLSKK
jgi:hypothetical protein